MKNGWSRQNNSALGSSQKTSAPTGSSFATPPGSAHFTWTKMFRSLGIIPYKFNCNFINLIFLPVFKMASWLVVLRGNLVWWTLRTCCESTSGFYEHVRVCCIFFYGLLVLLIILFSTVIYNGHKYMCCKHHHLSKFWWDA